MFSTGPNFKAFLSSTFLLKPACLMIFICFIVWQREAPIFLIFLSSHIIKAKNQIERFVLLTQDRCFLEMVTVLSFLLPISALTPLCPSSSIIPVPRSIPTGTAVCTLAYIKYTQGWKRGKHRGRLPSRASSFHPSGLH